MTNDLRHRNARLRRKIDGALKPRPELKTVVNYIALKQPANASLQQVQANLRARARAMITAKPEPITTSVTAASTGMPARPKRREAAANDTAITIWGRGHNRIV